MKLNKNIGVPGEIKLVIGQKYTLFYNEGNINNAIIEVKAFVDDVVAIYIKPNRKGALSGLQGHYSIVERHWFDIRKDRLTLITSN